MLPSKFKALDHSDILVYAFHATTTNKAGFRGLRLENNSQAEVLFPAKVGRDPKSLPPLWLGTP